MMINIERKISCYLAIFFCFFCLSAKQVVIQLEELPLNSKELLANPEGKEIQVRGFWYPLSLEEGILAPQPDLRSCCLQKPAKIGEQLFVKGKGLNFSKQRAITLQGILKADPKYNDRGDLFQLYVLEEAKEVKRSSFRLMWILSAVLVFSLGYLRLRH